MDISIAEFQQHFCELKSQFQNFIPALPMDRNQLNLLDARLLQMGEAYQFFLNLKASILTAELYAPIHALDFVAIRMSLSLLPM